MAADEEKMVSERRFLIAPSFARLIRRELGAGVRIVESYFPPQPDRNQIVRIEGTRCELVLCVEGEDGATTEERAEVPQPHAEALMDVAAGTIAFDRTPIPLGREVLLDSFLKRAGLHLLTDPLGRAEYPEPFNPPAWFGREVTADETFQRAVIALQGLPAIGEVPITNTGLEELLDGLERQGWRRAHERPAGALAAMPRRTERPAPSSSPAGGSRPAAGADEDEPLQKLARALAPQNLR